MIKGMWSYFEYARTTTSRFRSRFLTKENNFFTAAILKEYGARHMNSSPKASKFPLVLFNSMDGGVVQQDGRGLAPLQVEAVQLLDEVEHEEREG